MSRYSYNHDDLSSSGRRILYADVGVGQCGGDQDEYSLLFRDKDGEWSAVILFTWWLMMEKF